MSDPILLSDDEVHIVLDTPLPAPSKKRRTSSERDSNPLVLILDDDPTPQKLPSASTPSFVPDTPFSDLSIVKCTSKLTHFTDDPEVRVSTSKPEFQGINGVIQLESDNESDSVEKDILKKDDSADSPFNEIEDPRYHANFAEIGYPGGEVRFSQASVSSSCPASLPDDVYDYGYPVLSQNVDDYPDRDANVEQQDEAATLKSRKRGSTKKNDTDVANMRKRITKEEKARAAEEKKQEKIRAAEEKKQKREQDKLQKATLKAEAAELKKMQQWEKGKFAQKSIVADIDAKVVELGSVGGHLLSRFAEKGISFRIKQNPIERSITWTLTVPEHISQLNCTPIEVSYIALVYDAEEFCNLLVNGSILEHANSIRRRYPSHTICYLTNRLMAYINKREQGHYKNPEQSNGWRRPPVEETFAKLTTQYVRVHSRQCIDEAEVAEHIVGLTSSLASCQFRKRLTRLSVHANGSVLSKDASDRTIIKNNTWLKALVAIPKVQPRFAIAIWKKYPTMKSLLKVYMDSTKTVHEKEFLLKDLVTEGVIGDDRRLGEVCSKRVYRILMAQSGCIKTDDVEAGADFFTTS